MNYYTAQKVSNRTTRITSLSGEFLYLIEGDEIAVLVDTCLGVGGLRAFVEQLTQKPITVILTHGHVDHAMGAPEFDRVYMNADDYDLYREHQPLEVRREYMEMTLREGIPDSLTLDFVPPVPPAFLELAAGMTFDLGGIHLEIYAAAGHTSGMMAILIVEERSLILGDACNHSTFLFDEHAYSVEKYRESMLHLAASTQGKYDRAYLCHLESETVPDILPNMITLCDEIMARQTDDVPFTFMDYTCCIAKAVDSDFKRLDGGVGNVIYSVDKIFER